MLKLSASPTFKAKVEIPRQGDKPATITVEFRAKRLTDFEEWIKDRDEDRKVSEKVKEVMVGWEGVEEPFSQDALDTLLEVYPSSGMAIFAKYIGEHFKAKAGN